MKNQRFKKKKKSVLTYAKSHSHLLVEPGQKLKALDSLFCDLSDSNGLEVLKSTELYKEITSKSWSLLNSKHIPSSER